MGVTQDTGSRPASLDDVQFRSRLRNFLIAHAPGRPPRGWREQIEWKRAWARTKVDHNWAAPSWPTDWYGLGLPLRQQVIYHEEMTRARVPGHPDAALGMVGPTILQHGNDDQRRRFLLPMLRGDELWCQGFSEPDAGSDLPNLRTRAERDGDDYVVTGQKIWTTNAAIANWCFMLVRTGEPRSRQDGISYLLIDMTSKGLEVRPLRDMSGEAHFAELHLTDVRVPVVNRVGDENGGWRIARTTLGHERSTAHVGTSVRYRRVMSDLCDIARSLGRSSDPVMRQELAQLEILSRIAAFNGERILSNALAQGDVGPLASAFRLSHAVFEQRLHEAAMNLIGAQAMLSGVSLPPSTARWLWGFLRTRASTIGGGTSEVQRNTIAEQVLGLPREVVS